MDDKLKFILEKVLSLYKKYGLKSVTMDDVSRELGMSKKTLYLYVKDKRDLVEQVMFMEIDCFKNNACHSFNQNLNSIEEILEVFKLITIQFKEFNPSLDYDLRKYYPDFYEKIGKFKREHMYASFIENIEKGKKEGLYRKDIDAEIIAQLHVFRAENMVFYKVIEKTNFSPDTLYEIFNYHIRGVVNAKGLEFYESKLKELNIKND